MATNGERYKESIRNSAIQNEYDFIMALDDEFHFINESDDNYINNVVSFLDWKDEQFKEPIKLTEDEHNFLKHIKHGYTDRQIIVEKVSDKLLSKPVLHIDGDYLSFLDFKFSGLENDKKYTVTEILRNCEVVY